MRLEGFVLAPLQHEADSWLQASPYAVLSFVSANGIVAHARLGGLLNRLGIDDIELGRDIVARIVTALLHEGHLFEVRERTYSALPPYAVEREPDEWLVLGDSRVDQRLVHDGLFEVRSRLVATEVVLERLLVAPYSEALHTLESANVRIFRRGDLVELLPDIHLLAAPIPWEGFEPGTFARWDVCTTSGSWQRIESRFDVDEGLCRGVALDTDGAVLATKYFFAHEDGWSPLTSDDALLWELKVLSRGSHKPRAIYADASLSLPCRLPYQGYVALRFLSRGIHVNGSEIVANGVAFNVAKVLCERLGLELELEGT
jgi:hypothetical protein